jgi:hypothetical protein
LGADLQQLHPDRIASRAGPSGARQIRRRWPRVRLVVRADCGFCRDDVMAWCGVYRARGDMENRIKEQRLGLFADRTSAATMRAHQFRLWLSSVAYVPMSALRTHGNHSTGSSTGGMALNAAVTFVGPEPSSFVLFGLASLGFGVAAWRRRRAA